MKSRPNKQACIATLAWYGPNSESATKVVAAVLEQGPDNVVDLQRWVSGTTDMRHDRRIGERIAHFLKQYNVKQVVCADRIIGCPHEEGLDYPKGEDCPFCPYWVGRDRWTGGLKK